MGSPSKTPYTRGQKTEIWTALPRHHETCLDQETETLATHLGFPGKDPDIKAQAVH